MARYEWPTIKKNKELRQLEAFRDSFEEIKNCSVEIINAKYPDGLLTKNNKKISIELTEIIWDPDKDGINKKEQESLAAIIVDLAKKKYEKIGLPPVYISITFVDRYGLFKDDKTIKLNSGDKEFLSDYLLQTVIDNFPRLKNNELLKVEEINKQGKRLLPEKIRHIWISKLDELTENCWTIAGGGAIPPITREKINYIIEKKEKALLNYKDQFDENWLVMLEYWNGLSGYFDFGFIAEQINETFQSGFSRIFILRSRRYEVIELKIIK